MADKKDLLTVVRSWAVVHLKKIAGTKTRGGRKQSYIAYFPLEKIVPEEANKQIFTSGNPVGPLLKIGSLFELIRSTRCTTGTRQISNNNNNSRGT